MNRCLSVLLACLILLAVLPGCTPFAATDSAATLVAADQLPAATRLTASVTVAVSPTARPSPTLVSTNTPSATPLPPTPSAAPSATSEPPSPTVAPPSPTVVPATAAIPPTARPTQPVAPTSLPAVGGAAPGGKIFYLASDGRTINTIHPDGTNIQRLLVVDKRSNEIVLNLIGESSGTFLLYAVAPVDGAQWPEYFLVRSGRAQRLARFASLPRWSPDGKRFVAQIAEESSAGGAIYLYDTATGEGRELPARGRPDWFPDGKHLVYVGTEDEAVDVLTFDLATNTSTKVTKLPSEGDETWGVQEAHVLPDGQSILFYGGQRKAVGASGNGQQWWTIPVGGGEPRPFSEVGGNGILDYDIKPEVDLLAYAEGAHSSACLSLQTITIAGAGVGGGVALDVPAPEDIPQSETESTYVRGISFAPDSSHLAFAMQPYRCTDAGVAPETSPPAVYTWFLRAANGPGSTHPRKLVDGAYPVWIR